MEKTGWSVWIIVADQGANLVFSTSHRTVTAWIDPGMPVAVEAAVVGLADIGMVEAAGAGSGSEPRATIFNLVQSTV